VLYTKSYKLLRLLVESKLGFTASKENSPLLLVTAISFVVVFVTVTPDKTS